MRNAKSCGEMASPGFSIEIAEPSWSMLTKPHDGKRRVEHQTNLAGFQNPDDGDE